MKLFFNTNEAPQRKAISLTTYRALFIIILLTEGEKSAEEILEAFLNDKILTKSCHKDTLNNSINILRMAGFEIEKPKPSNKYRYKLKSLPFRFLVTKEDIELLNRIRETLYFQNNYELIFKLNTVYDELQKYIDDEELKNELENSNHLRYINRDILNEIIELCKEKATARIIYNSPVNGEEELKITAREILFENKRLYLCLHSFKHNKPAYFRIDKILAVKKCAPTSEDDQIKANDTVKYEIWGETAKNFIPTSNESIIEEKEGRITVSADIISDFHFFQRIIAFADECKIIEPTELKEQYLKHIDKVMEIYTNEDSTF